MIIGGGMLARAFAATFSRRDDVLIFASGVSNSQERSAQTFDRERAMLAPIRERHAGIFVYFGSSCSEDSNRDDAPYANHKRAMEALVLSRPGGLVLRLPQVVGWTENPNTLTNFLSRKIMTGEEFIVWRDAERNLIDVDDVAAIGAIMVEEADASESRSLTIASRRSLPVAEIVSLLEEILSRPAFYRSEPGGSPLQMMAPEAQVIAQRLGIDLGDGYARRVLRKYYGQRD